MAGRKKAFSFRIVISEIIKFIREHHITSAKVELYLYRTIVLLITLVHLIKFLWFSVSH